MKNRVVKAKNLLAFRIWLEKLGYSVKTLTDNRGFTFSLKKNMDWSQVTYRVMLWQCNWAKNSKTT